MGSISFWELGLIVNSVWFHETLEVSPGFVESVFDFLDKGEVRSLLGLLNLGSGQKGTSIGKLRFMLREIL